MAMSSSTTVAASVAPYYSDNYTARTGTSAYRVPEGNQAEFSDWKAQQSSVQWYKLKDGNSLKYFSVSGTGTVPPGAEAVEDTELNIVYASLDPSLQQSLVDFAMSRAADEMLQNAGYAYANNFLTRVPEIDVNADLSALSQNELLQLLQRLVRISQTLNSASASGAVSDTQSKALSMGLSVSLLAQSIKLQTDFNTDSAATEELDRDGVDDDDALNQLFKNAIDNMVGGYVAGMAAEALAFNAIDLQPLQLQALTRTVTESLLNSLRASADLGFLASSAELQFAPTVNVLPTQDGTVLYTAREISRRQQADAVRAQLTAALNDPGAASNLSEAIAENADNLGTAEMPLPRQSELYRDVAAAVIDAILKSPSLLDEIAREAVDSGSRFFELLNNELESAANLESAEQQRFN